MIPEYGSLNEESLLRGVLAALPEPFFIYDEEGTYIDVLGGIDRRKYHDARHLIGRKVEEIMPAEPAALIREKIREALETGTVITCEYSLDPNEMEVYAGRPGPMERRWFEAHISPVQNSGGTLKTVVWMAFDITAHKTMLRQLREKQEKLNRISRIDSLTRLLNRRSFFLEARSAIQSCRKRKGPPLWLMMLDLDHFKQVNDQFGHYVGDKCLREFARILAKAAPQEALIERLGGEEFSIITPEAEASAINSKAEHIRAVTENTLVVFDHIELRLTVSIGVTRIHDDEDDIIEGLRRADAKMYKAKETGRNRIYC